MCVLGKEVKLLVMRDRRSRGAYASCRRTGGSEEPRNL